MPETAEDADEIHRTDGGATPAQILELNSRGSTSKGPDDKRHDSSTEPARELLTEWVATHVDEQRIATAKTIVKESERDDVGIGAVGRTLGCRNVGVTPDGFLEEVELSTWGDGNVTSWVFERVDGEREQTQSRSDRLFKPELVTEISDAVGGIEDEYYLTIRDHCRRIEISVEWKRAVTLALAETVGADLRDLLSGYEDDGVWSYNEYVNNLSKDELSNIVETLLDADDDLVTPYSWPREALAPIHEVLVEGHDPSEVDA